MNRCYLRVLCLLILILPSAYCQAEVFPMGGDRPTFLQTPKDYPAQGTYPLVLFLHGFTGSSAAYERYLHVRDELSALGFLSIVPDGSKNSKGQQFWNATPECCDFENSGIDDLGYLLGLIREAQARFAIDPQRIYVMGHSNGGFMAYRLACEAQGLVSGIISIAGANFKDTNLCNFPVPLNILQIHGDADDTVPYGDGQSFPAPRASLQFWQKLYSCHDEVSAPLAIKLMQSPNTTDTQADTDTFEFTSCQDKHALGFWILRGGPHTPAFIARTLFSESLQFIEKRASHRESTLDKRGKTVMP